MCAKNVLLPTNVILVIRAFYLMCAHNLYSFILLFQLSQTKSYQLVSFGEYFLFHVDVMQEAKSNLNSLEVAKNGTFFYTMC